MEKNKFRGMAKRKYKILLWVLFPAIILDIVIHEDKWDEFYDDSTTKAGECE